MKRSRSIALLIAATLAAAGCGTTQDPPTATPGTAGSPSPAVTLPPEQPGPGDHELAMMFDGVKRDYLVHAPSSYKPDKPIPLVLIFHGRPGSSANIASMTMMNPTADEKGFLAVYPQGMQRQWRATAHGSTDDDVRFIGALIDHLIDTWNVDSKRVYAAGLSNGADMTYRLAWELSNKIAAAAPVSGYFDRMRHWTPTLPEGNSVSLITFQGSEDRFAIKFPDANELWSTAAGCGKPRVTTFKNADGTGTKSSAKCTNGGVHVIYSVNRMGHVWPLGSSRLLPIDANPVIWEFFLAHPMR